jgi:Uma2 family endonuclease
MSVPTAAPPVPFVDVPVVIPSLEPGDRLTRAEFERRYSAMPKIHKAELIEGVVHMPSPVRLKKHAQPHSALVGWLFTYKAHTPGVEDADNASVRLDLDNEPQPDAALFIDPACGGQARISEDDYLEGAPELVGEVSASTVSIDLHTKLQVYRRSAVQEYIVWRVLDKEVDWFRLEADEFQRLPKDASGYYRSRVFPGLWLDAAALLRGDMATVLQVLQEGLNSPGHAEFVRRLQAAGSGRGGQP